MALYIVAKAGMDCYWWGGWGVWENPKVNLQATKGAGGGAIDDHYEILTPQGKQYRLFPCCQPSNNQLPI